MALPAADLFLVQLNSLPDVKIVHLSKLKAFADGKKCM